MAKRKLALSTLILCMSVFHPLAQALAISEIQLNSELNQTLNAVVELSADADELASLNLSISRLESESASLQQWPGIMAQLIMEENGRNIIKITSKEVIREPVIEFLLELDWSKGRIKREYSLLIDPH